MTCQADLVSRRRSTFASQCGLRTQAWQPSGQGMAGSTMPTRHTPVLQAGNYHKCLCSQMFSDQLCSLAGSISPGCKPAHLPVWQLYPPFKGESLPSWDHTAQVEWTTGIDQQSASRL